jgi:hypothetical protein
MNPLLEKAIQAHGGWERWQGFKEMKATIVTGGALWGIKGLVQDPAPREMTVSLHEQAASVRPFGNPDWHTSFKPGRIAIEDSAGAVVRERLEPRASFAGHQLDTPWDPLHRAYFNGYALWIYLTTPFFMAMPGMQVTEIAPWVEGHEKWQGLRVRFPEGIETHSQEQDFYFGSDFLLRRHDYHVDVAGGFAAAQYVGDIKEFSGLRFPTRRRAYVRDDKGFAKFDELMVSIDLHDIRLS